MMKKCPDCHGSGFQYLFGFWPRDWNGCGTCRGRGKVDIDDIPAVEERFAETTASLSPPVTKVGVPLEAEISPTSGAQSDSDPIVILSQTDETIPPAPVFQKLQSVPSTKRPAEGSEKKPPQSDGKAGDKTSSPSPARAIPGGTLSRAELEELRLKNVETARQKRQEQLASLSRRGYSPEGITPPNGDKLP